MPQLELLDLSFNRLGTIPEDVGGMKALRVLSLLHNRIENVPPNIASMDTLSILRLGGNPLVLDLRRLVEAETLAANGGAYPDNEKDSIKTRKLKKYLRTVAARSTYSAGESR